MSDARQARLDDYRMTFGTPQGQRVLADFKLLADRPQIDVHGATPADPLKAACLEGHRQFYLRILAVLAEAERTMGTSPEERVTDTYLEVEEPAYAG